MFSMFFKLSLRPDLCLGGSSYFRETKVRYVKVDFLYLLGAAAFPRSSQVKTVRGVRPEAGWMRWGLGPVSWQNTHQFRGVCINRCIVFSSPGVRTCTGQDVWGSSFPALPVSASWGSLPGVSASPGNSPLHLFTSDTVTNKSPKFRFT